MQGTTIQNKQLIESVIWKGVSAIDCVSFSI